MVATFFAPTATLTLTNAGHPAPALYRAADRRWTWLDPASFDEPAETNVPLGILDVGDYDERSLTLEPGDLVLFFTDFVLESRNRNGRQLGRDGVMELLQNLDGRCPERIIPDLLAQIEKRDDGNLGRDDATLMLVAPNGTRRIPKLARPLLTSSVHLAQALTDRLPGGRGR